MRIAMAIATMAILAACGGGSSGNASFASAFDDGFRTSFRTKYIESCVAGAEGAPVKIDLTELCSCAADATMKGKSVKDLMKGPTDAEQKAIIAQCLKAHPPKV